MRGWVTNPLNLPPNALKFKRKDFKLERNNLNKKVIFDVYITKYALTKGIFKSRVVISTFCETMVRDVKTQICYHGEGRDWHRTVESALKRAEEMKRKRIISLKKSIEKLEKLKFKID